MSPSSSAVEDSHPVVVHRLPCVIEHDGPAEVSKYFRPNLEEKKASFRGRHLVSSELVFPEQHTSIVHMIEKSSDGNWKCNDVDQIYQWHHDYVDHSVQTSLYKAADYLDLMSNFVQK